MRTKGGTTAPFGHVMSVAFPRAAGKARIEGKDYVMRDGDVVEFRFNV